jgi:hypoxanthine phosphoribosyltransferase
MERDVKKVLISNEEIVRRSKELAEQINHDYAGKKPILVGLLKGSVPFMAELLKYINLYCQTEYMVVSSYRGGTQTTGEIKIVKDIDVSMQGRDIIIVEDIVDTGITLNTIVKLLKHRGANSVEIACLLNKEARRVMPVDVKYSGFSIPDEFVIGYGLDYAEMYRNLPYVGVLKEEVYQRREA